MRDIQAPAVKRLTPEPNSEQLRCPAWWRVITYLMATLPFLLIIAFGWLNPDLNRQEVLDWRPTIALADSARERGDLYEARHLYLQVERIASWQEDSEGLMAAACGFKKLDGAEGPHSKSFAILVRAMAAAESKQNRSGMLVLAKAFTAVGHPKAASMALARIQPDWPEETHTSSGVYSGDCWEAR